jgi:DNA repair ATPase RecN
MSDSVDTPTDVPAAAPEAPAAPAPQKDEALPEWARKQITDANQEAANYRRQLREAQASNSELHEKVSSLTDEKSQIASVQSDFDKLATAVQTLFPETHTQVFTFAKTLQGSTEEELAKHAADLNSMFGISTGPAPATDRSQGQGAPAGSDPATEFAAFLSSQLTR